jgi:hypothetical protein
MNENRMAVLIPSRGRPENIKRFMQAVKDTEADVDIYVGIDPDDPRLDDYWDLPTKYRNLYINEGTERQRFGPTLNRLCNFILHLNDCGENYKYIMWCGDDHVPRSKNWDKEYMRVLDDLGVGIVYGNDLVMGEAIATELAMTTNIVEGLGYAVPEGFVHLYIDNYFMELGKAINKLVYLPGVVVQHMHPCAGTAQEDQTYIEANSPENWTNDRIRLNKYLAEELQADVAKLRSVENEKTKG